MEDKLLFVFLFETPPKKKKKKKQVFVLASYLDN